MPSAAPDPRLIPGQLSVDRFHRALLDRHLLSPGGKLAVAVSGGPDSLALLLLAHAALPGRITAATVDHGLRPESRDEAAMVAHVCDRLDVRHATLSAPWHCDHKDGLQAAARAYRYRELAAWCSREGAALLATAHHADDQAETLLMRLARGAGVGGLASIRRVRNVQACLPADLAAADEAITALRLVRPLLRFTKAELVDIVAKAGLDAVNDPSNAADRFDRTRARALLAATDWLDPARMAASASHLADAEEALAWAADGEYARRVTVRTDPGTARSWTLDPAKLPDELLRRLVGRLIRSIENHATAASTSEPTGPELSRFISRLRDGQIATLSHVLARPGPLWHFTLAPPRRL